MARCVRARDRLMLLLLVYSVVCYGLMATYMYLVLPQRGFKMATPGQLASSVGTTPPRLIVSTRPSPSTRSSLSQALVSLPSNWSGQRRQHYKMVVGITTALREEETVLWMAQELVRYAANSSSYKFIVWQSFSVSKDTVMKKELEGMGFTVFTQTSPYPELADDRFHITHKDSPERVRWRTNHVLDYANLMERALEYESDYILMLEDDMKPSKHALDKAYSSIEEKLHHVPIDEVGFVSLFGGIHYEKPEIGPRRLKDISRHLDKTGACALLYPRIIVPTIVKVLREDPYANPADLLVFNLIDKRLRLRAYERVPHLFQHISMKSTFNVEGQLKDVVQWRSMLFLYDEDNMTMALSPSNPAGYIGCYHDNPVWQDLCGKRKLLPESTGVISRCREFCKGYSSLFFGIQEQGQLCLCGNDFGFFGKSSDCSRAKDGMSGGTAVNAVYRTDPFTAKYIGCFRDNDTQRDLSISRGGNKTPIDCLNACSGYKYFGLQYGGECYCGDSYGRYGVGFCRTYCSADMKYVCGGTLSNSVFQTLDS